MMSAEIQVLDGAEERLSSRAQMMETAEVASRRSTCSRLHVGAVLHREWRPIASGYNGVLPGMPHCKHVDDSQCDDAVHAEANVFAFCAKYGIETQGADLVVTHQPCLKCAQLIIAAGISSVVYKAPYRRNEGLELLKRAGVTVDKFD